MSLIIAGTNSGSGKSTVTLGLLAALRAGDRVVQPFKAGPDFIDPGLHTLVTGRVSRNLDLWMCGEDYVRRCLLEKSSDAEAAVIEGVMGLYDGGERSTAALARATGASVVLVVDAYGMAESAGALIGGFNDYGCKLSGVIFNRVGSARHYERLRDSVPHGVEALGYLPRDTSYSIPERHLGLTVAEEGPLDAQALKTMVNAVNEHMDMNRILELARPAYDEKAIEPEKEPPIHRATLGVARDKAFCFYYQDNLDMLRQAGARLVFFSPLNDKSLPEGLDGVYMGGGYPELYAGELAANEPMLKSIRQWVEGGGPLYAECGGLMYLGEKIEVSGEAYAMCAALPLGTRLLDRRAALGYREVTLAGDCMLGRAGRQMRGHEFHYSEVTGTQSAKDASYNVMGEDKSSPVSSVMYKSALASYTHLHLGSAPGAAGEIIEFIKGRQ